MKRLAIGCALGALAIFVWLPHAWAGAPLYPKLDWRPGGGHITVVQPLCGGEIVRILDVGKKAARLDVLEPNVGDAVTNYMSTATWGRITRVRGIARTGEVRVTIRGEQEACRDDPNRSKWHTGGTIWVAAALWTSRPRGLLRFHPWTPDGRPTLRIRGRQRGTCTQSWINRRDDAWRCITGRFVLDPCFSHPEVFDRLMCALSPWGRDGFIVIGSGFDTWKSKRPIWALRTTGGHRCNFLSGITDIRSGRRLNYGCQGRGGVGGRGYLWGDPKRRNGRLMIPYSRSYETSSPWRWVRVVERWN